MTAEGSIAATELPGLRLRTLNAAPPCWQGDYVLYWMVAARRTTYSFALERAVEWARASRRPLLVFEPLRCDYRWASARLHAFVLQGMADNLARLATCRGVHAYPWVEPGPGAGRGLLEALAERAVVVITDEFPEFFIPRMQRAVAPRLRVRAEVVDSCGLLPLRATEEPFPTAYAFRRFLQKRLGEEFDRFPRPDPLAEAKLVTTPVDLDSLHRRWPPASPALLAAEPAALSALPIDPSIAPAAMRGGESTARAALEHFIEAGLARYTERSQPDAEVTSGLSPYLHFGHIAAHEVFHAVMREEGWSPARVAARATGSRAGWWGVGAAAEGFLDQLVTWRELGFNMAWHRPSHDTYESLPDWARRTLDEHAVDPRPWCYESAVFERAATHDPLWNAAQRQLVQEGRLHNYLRMLWGKKILEWSASPREALATMIELNNKYALDGRDPNSYSGIFWTLGRYDRPWGPTRPIFGTVRYMSSENTARKLRVRDYLGRYGGSQLFSAPT